MIKLDNDIVNLKDELADMQELQRILAAKEVLQFIVDVSGLSDNQVDVLIELIEAGFIDSFDSTSLKLHG